MASRVLLGLSLALFAVPGLALKDMRMLLPSAARVGLPVRLSCQYDLEGAQLYSIKWYHDETEFYSYVPKEEPATRIYPDNGIAVDLAQSDSNNVTLLNVTRSLSGFYKCEVSADMPNFHTDIQTEYLAVFEPPSQKPEVTVEKLSGGAFRVNCSTSPSFPAPNITWFVDNRQQPAAVQFHAVVPPNPPPPPQPSNAEPHSPAGPAGPAAGEPEPQEWSSSSLVVSLLAGKGPRSVRCQAAIHDVWTQSSAELALRGAGDHPQLAPVRGAASACGSLTRWGLWGSWSPWALSLGLALAHALASASSSSTLGLEATLQAALGAADALRDAVRDAPRRLRLQR